MAATYDLISIKQTQAQGTSGNIAYFSFEDIPQTYTDLKLCVWGNLGTSGTNFYVSYNNDNSWSYYYSDALGTQNYGKQSIECNDTSAQLAHRYSDGNAGLVLTGTYAIAQSSTYSMFLNFDVLNYSSSTMAKSCMYALNSTGNSTGYHTWLTGLSVYKRMEPIQSIQLFTGTTNWDTNGWMALYGIKAA